jgi:sugar phosphate isomerase/epimerase
MTLLSLDCLTLTDCTYQEVIDSAAGAGFDLVSLWLNPLAAFPRQVVQPHQVTECAARLRDLGIGVHQIEAFDLASREAIEAARPCFAAGAELGARAVLFYHGANPDRDRTAEVLAHACGVAAEYGLGVNLEPVSFARTRTLAEARQLIGDAGVDSGIVLDVLHHIRAGGTGADITAVPTGMIRYVQINDGPLSLPRERWPDEAMNERAYPGEGGFPLPQLLRHLPRDVPWGVEAPSIARRRRGLDSRDQARAVWRALTSVMGDLTRFPDAPVSAAT